jgi:hypothetical protein
MTTNPREFGLDTGAIDAIAADIVHGVAASVRAGPAAFGADAAVFVPLGMARAFFTAHLAGCRAQLERGAKHPFIRSGAARGEVCRHPANVGAIEVQADTLPQVFDVRFRHARIGARRTVPRACQTLVDAIDKDVKIAVLGVRMKTDYMLTLHGGLPCYAF